MERLSKYKEVVTIINNIDSMKVGFHFFDDFGIVKEFKNEDEAIEFMEKEYYILKCECLEESRKELNRKIDNQRKQLFNLNKACNKLKGV